MMGPMEFLLQILLDCPKCWRVVFGVTLPDHLLDALPLARTGFELALIAAAAVCCWLVVWALRSIETKKSPLGRALSTEA